MNCDCGGVLIEGKSAHRITEEHFSLIIEDIPAYRCVRCKKVLFDEETVEKIKKIERRLKRETNELITGQSSTKLYDY